MQSLTKFWTNIQINPLVVAVASLYWLTMFIKGHYLSLYFLGGGIVGLLFFPFLKQIIKEDDKPIIESVVTQIPLAFLTFYAGVTSTSEFGLGFIGTIFLYTILRFVEKWQIEKNVVSWFWPIKIKLNQKNLTIYCALMAAIFLYASFA